MVFWIVFATEINETLIKITWTLIKHYQTLVGTCVKSLEWNPETILNERYLLCDSWWINNQTKKIVTPPPLPIAGSGGGPMSTPTPP